MFPTLKFKKYLRAFLDALRHSNASTRHRPLSITDVIDRISASDCPGVLLQNVLVPTPSGEAKVDSTEIAALYITRKGMFVIDVVQATGWIFGSEDSKIWTQIFKGGARQKFYNPLKRAVDNVRTLWRIMAMPVSSIVIVAFTDHCELKQINLISPDAHVIKFDELYDTIMAIWQDSPDYVTQAEIETIARKLQPLANTARETRRAYIE